MIQIIRVHYIAPEKPAGEIITYDQKDEDMNCLHASQFLYEKNVFNYIVIKNGRDVDIRGCFDVFEIEERLKNFQNF